MTPLQDSTEEPSYGAHGEALKHDALGQAKLVLRGKITALELVDAAIERLHRLNPVLNCVVTDLSDFARVTASGATADGLRGQLTNVPVLLKDLGQQIAGVRQTDGSRALQDAFADRDSWLAARYRDAGMVFLGKTSSPEFGNHSTSEPAVHGACRNPWNLQRTAGGSSGGAAAAVAAGIVAAAGASDGAGSIRIPASCCGVFGLKPTRARISAAPFAGEPLFGLAVTHAITRSVRDSAALLDAAHGPDPGDPYQTPPPMHPFLDEVGQDPGRLRIALCTESPFGTPVNPECVAAAEQTATLLEALGHHVEYGAPSFDTSAVTDDMLVVWAVSNTRSHDAIVEKLHRPLRREELEITTWELVDHGKARSAVELQMAIHRMHAAGRDVAPFFARYDVWLTPTLAQPPAPLGVLNRSRGDARAWWQYDLEFNPFNPLANITGQPSASLPLHQSKDGLPIGILLTTPYGRDDMLLRLAAQLEQAQPWAQQRPRLNA